METLDHRNLHCSVDLGGRPQYGKAFCNDLCTSCRYQPASLLITVYLKQSPLSVYMSRRSSTCTKIYIEFFRSPPLSLVLADLFFGFFKRIWWWNLLSNFFFSSLAEESVGTYACMHKECKIWNWNILTLIYTIKLNTFLSVFRGFISSFVHLVEEKQVQLSVSAFLLQLMMYGNVGGTFFLNLQEGASPFTCVDLPSRALQVST